MQGGSSVSMKHLNMLWKSMVEEAGKFDLELTGEAGGKGRTA